MLAWHLAAVTFLFRWIFRDPKVDMRFLWVGAVLPDLIDLTAATLLDVRVGELWAHGLLAPSALAVVVLLVTRRGRLRRRWMAMVVAWLFHLLIDGMWLDNEVFLWPILGWDITDGPGSAFWPGAWARAVTDPWRWVMEVGGIIYLARLWMTSGLTEAAARRRLVRTGGLGNRARHH